MMYRVQSRRDGATINYWSPTYVRSDYTIRDSISDVKDQPLQQQQDILRVKSVTTSSWQERDKLNPTTFRST